MQQAPVLLKKEAAKQLKIGLTSLNRLINAGKIQQIELTPRRRGILQTDIDAYLTAQRVGGATNAPAA